MSKNDSKRLKCFNCQRRRNVLINDWQAQKDVADSYNARLEIVCGYCFEYVISDPDDKHSSELLTSAEILTELLISPDKRRWRWINRF